MKASLSEVPLSECGEIYRTIKLSQLPENVLQSQLCASKVEDDKVFDACQGWLNCRLHLLSNDILLPQGTQGDLFKSELL